MGPGRGKPKIAFLSLKFLRWFRMSRELEPLKQLGGRRESLVLADVAIIFVCDDDMNAGIGQQIDGLVIPVGNDHNIAAGITRDVALDRLESGIIQGDRNHQPADL